MIKNADFYNHCRRLGIRQSLDRFYSDSDNKLIRKIHLLFEVGAVVAFKTVLAVFIRVTFSVDFYFSYKLQYSGAISQISTFVL